MAEGLVSDTNLTAIANAIRTKNGSSDTYTPAEMATAITNIPTSQVDEQSALKYMLEHRTNYAGIAAGLTTLTTLPTFTQPSGVSVYTDAFSGCTNLTAVSGIDVGQDLASGTKEISVANMFNGCSSLTSVPSFAKANDSSGYSSGMFSGCSSLTSVEVNSQIVRSSGSTKDASRVFYGCQNLTQFNTGNKLQLGGILNLSSFFYNCEKLASVDLSLQVPGSTLGTNANGMFYGCLDLETIKGSVCSCVIDAGYMFYNCGKLTTINASRTSTMSDKPMVVSFTFSGCSSLVSVSLENWYVTDQWNNTFKGCTSLSNKSLNDIMAVMVDASRNKTLKRAGFTSAQASVMTTLSNWAALSAAGWTTGY